MNLIKRLILVIGLLGILPGSLFLANNLALAAEKKIETITIKQYRLAYYDIWKNSAGQWIEGIGPEDTVLNYKESISMPSKLISGEYKNIKAKIDLQPIGGEEFNDVNNENFNRNFFNYLEIIEKFSAKFSLSEMNISEDNTQAYFKSIKLLAESEGDNITKEWQGVNVAGRRYYMPFTVIWTAEKVEEEEEEEAKRNVAITSIHPNNFILGFKKQVLVGVKNLGETTITTNVDFTNSTGGKQQQSVTLAPGDGTELTFFITPTAKKFTLTAEANKARHFEETTYTDNKKTVNCTAEEEIIPVNEKDCSDLLYWTEPWSHKVTYTDSSGKSKSYTCSHTYTYSSKLSAVLKISPKTFKSGYGFGVQVKATMSKPTLVTYIGCGVNSGRPAETKPDHPTKVEVRLPWKVENRLGTQPKTVLLEKVLTSGSSVTFEPAENKISEIKARKIYTPVELKGTKEKPVNHKFAIYISGGGIGSTPWCKLLEDEKVSITINGNMYEDDLTSGDR